MLFPLNVYILGLRAFQQMMRNEVLSPFVQSVFSRSPLDCNMTHKRNIQFRNVNEFGDFLLWTMILALVLIDLNWVYTVNAFEVSLEKWPTSPLPRKAALLRFPILRMVQELWAGQIPQIDARRIAIYVTSFFSLPYGRAGIYDPSHRRPSSITSRNWMCLRRTSTGVFTSPSLV